MEIESVRNSVTKDTNKAHIDYVPCDECEKLMDGGITVIEVDKEPYLGQPYIAEGMYPTGKWSNVSDKFVKDKFSDVDSDKIIKAGNMLMCIKEFRDMGLDLEKDNLN